MQKINQTAANERMLQEVLAGLINPQKLISSKYFYDKRGSQLFEEICSLDEYYLTDAELQIMEENIREITEYLGPGIELIELGSGSSTKTRLLLDHLSDISAYIPIDISGDFLSETTDRLRADYPELNVRPVVADYTRQVNLPLQPGGNKRVIYFPGSTIGNFDPEEAKAFLDRLSKLLGENDGLLIGVDLIKDREILHNAYNDSKGVTAEFNKNLLVRLNRELDADFDPDQFRHLAFFNDEESRIEMHLESLKDQVIRIGGREILFRRGETIHTENSCKYSLESFTRLVSDHYSVQKVWTDQEDLFSVQYLEFLTFPG